MTRISEGTSKDLVSREILRQLTQHGALTRAQLCETLEVPRSTIAEHVRVLLRQGAILEGPADLSHRGRPARVLMLAPGGSLYAVIVLTHGQGLTEGPILAALVDSHGETRWRHRAEPGSDPLRTCEHVIRVGVAALRLKASDVAKVVVVAPLPVAASPANDGEPPASRIVYGPQPLGEQPHVVLSRRLDIPGLLINDADAAALGEANFGHGRGCDVVYLKTITGLGMGIVTGGRLQSGAGAAVGEIAHVPRSGASTVCSCGTAGCWFADTHGNGLGLTMMARHAGATTTTFNELEAACGTGDRHVIEAVRNVGESIGRIVSSFYLLTQPVLTLLEEKLGAAFQPLAYGMRQGISAHTPGWAGAGAGRIEQGALEVPEILGAVAFANLDHPQRTRNH